MVKEVVPKKQAPAGGTSRRRAEPKTETAQMNVWLTNRIAVLEKEAGELGKYKTMYEETKGAWDQCHKQLVAAHAEIAALKESK